MASVMLRENKRARRSYKVSEISEMGGGLSRDTKNLPRLKDNLEVLGNTNWPELKEDYFWRHGYTDLGEEVYFPPGFNAKNGREGVTMHTGGMRNLGIQLQAAGSVSRLVAKAATSAGRIVADMHLGGWTRRPDGSICEKPDSKEEGINMFENYEAIGMMIRKGEKLDALGQRIVDAAANFVSVPTVVLPSAARVSLSPEPLQTRTTDGIGSSHPDIKQENDARSVVRDDDSDTTQDFNVDDQSDHTSHNMNASHPDIYQEDDARNNVVRDDDSDTTQAFSDDDDQSDPTQHGDLTTAVNWLRGYLPDLRDETYIAYAGPFVAVGCISDAYKDYLLKDHFQHMLFCHKIHLMTQLKLSFE